MALPRVGDTGSVTVAAGPPLYSQFTGEIFRWDATVNSDEFERTTFATSTTNVAAKQVAKGMYVVRGTLEGYWNTGALTAEYTKFAVGRGAVALNLIARDGTTDQEMVLNAKLNNYRITSDKQAGLISFACDFVSEGDITSVTDFT